MKTTLTILVLLTAALSAQLQFKRIGWLPSGIIAETFGRPVCYDTDHNGLKEITYATGSNYPGDPFRWEIWEYRPLNRFELVYADTGCYPPGPGITSGNFRPYDAGDIDRDGLTDLAGTNEDWIQPGSLFNDLIGIYESPTHTSYPTTLAWSFEWGPNPSMVTPPHLRDNLDSDTNRELVDGVSDSSIIWGVWENRGDNQNQLVWHSPTPQGAELTFGDFDGDGRQEFASASGPTWVRKCTGDDQYTLIYTDTTGLANGYDVFSGDVNGDGNPEFLVGFYDPPTWTYTLLVWYAVGVNAFRRALVDSKTHWSPGSGQVASQCGDIDGDGVAEIVWAAPDSLYIYKMTGPNQFQQVWQWQQDNGTEDGIFVSIADVNNDGYSEIVASGGGINGSARTSVFEIEAVRVLQPNGGETYVPGEDHYIKWQAFTPPRCDSLSVLFTPDNGRTLDLLAHGLPPGTDSILWQVPDLTSDSCKIRVIAYGPGAQADESDSVFSINSTGVSGNPGPPVYETRLIGASPNPLTQSTTIKFQIGVGGGPISLHVCDVSGRTVATLADGVLKSGVYHRDWEVAPTVPNGVYFLSFTADGVRESRKLILTR